VAHIVPNGVDWSQADSASEETPDPVEELFAEETELDRWSLLTEAIRLHRQALEEPDGSQRSRMLQEVIRLHSRWAQSQSSAGSRSFAPARRRED
jgi:hypothetical protein